MDIKFIYIKGLSRTDSIHFDNINQRNEYMSKGESYTVITDAYYPPHYHLSLKLDTVDIDFNTQANYVNFEYNGKQYYYFIDRYKYLNENIIEYYLTMDTIMTYYFDIEKISGVIERNTINRWISDDVINRDYIEEDISSHNFIKYNIHTDFINNDVSVQIYQAYAGKFTSWIAVNGLTTTIPYAPIFKFKCKDGEISKVVYKGTTYSNASEIFETSSYTLQCFGSIPLDYFNCSYTLSVDSSGVRTLTINSVGNGNFGGYEVDKITYLGLHGISYDNALSNNRHTFTLGGVRNKSKGVGRQDYYCPYLCSQNYIKIMYGENNDLKVMKTNKLTSLSHKFYLLYDFNDGNRIYVIDNLNSGYNEYKICTSTNTLPMSTSNWNEYYSRNKHLYYLQTGLGSILPIMQIASGDVGKGISGALSGVKYQAQMSDLENSPENYKSSSTFMSNYAVNNFIPIIYYYKVKDINNCMNYFENYGVRVDKTVYNASLNSLYNRTYFDYISFSDINLGFGCLMSEELSNDFISRLNKGVRFWHYDDFTYIGDYHFDNVEKTWN